MSNSSSSSLAYHCADCPRVYTNHNAPTSAGIKKKSVANPHPLIVNGNPFLPYLKMLHPF